MQFDLDHYLNHREQYPDGIPVAVIAAPVPSLTIDATEPFAPYLVAVFARRLDIANRARSASAAAELADEMRKWQAANPDLVKGRK